MELHTLVEEFSTFLANREGAIFCGAGISVPSNLPKWADLLRPFARRIGIEIRSDDSLPQIAQYIVNANGGNRGPLVHSIKSSLTGSFPLNKYHESLSQTNVDQIWTTNFDTLLENAFWRFVVDVKARDDAISRSVSSHEIEIIKIHGCVATGDAADLVLTLEDYEDFFERRPATADRLRVDLLNKSFLFVGYGYQDPDITNILVQARRLAYKATRQHYMIQAEADTPEDVVRQRLWFDDLKRVGIACVLISDHSELEAALAEIALKSRGATVYVTGGHLVNLPLIGEFGKAVSRIRDLILLDGQSSGVSRHFISAFTTECLSNKEDIRDRIRLFANPYAVNKEFENDPALLPQLKEWRAAMLRGAQVLVVFHGGMGTAAEVEVAREVGTYILPVPMTLDDMPSNLLKDPVIREALAQKDPEYLKAADAMAMTPDIFERCVRLLTTT